MSSEPSSQRSSTAGQVFLPMMALAILFLVFLARAAATYGPPPAVPEIAQPGQPDSTAALDTPNQVSLK